MNDSLAILLPVHNAQQSLIGTVTRALEIAAELTPRCEIAIIDDGSSDGTEEIACDLALRYPQVVLARHHRPRGIDEAIHTGVQATHGSILIIAPPETELQASEVRRLWRIGVGIETSPAASTTPARNEPSNVVSRLVKWGQALREEGAMRQSGPRMVRRELYRRRAAKTGFRPTRVDGKQPAVPAAAPNFLTQLRDFAFGE